jgi:Rod binding domain-containing protein
MGNSIISGVLSNPSTSFGPGSKDSPEKIRHAATEFESLMIGQIMKGMHEEDGEGWLGTGEDQTASSAMGMADEYFAKAMASKGGLGLANMISKNLAANERK